MENQYTRNVLLGLIIGGMAGGAMILLVAAQSAKLARAKIRQQGSHWIDRAAGITKLSPAQVRYGIRARTSGKMTVHLA
jgi:gas vesicle protein